MSTIDPTDLDTIDKVVAELRGVDMSGKWTQSEGGSRYPPTKYSPTRIWSQAGRLLEEMADDPKIETLELVGPKHGWGVDFYFYSNEINDIRQGPRAPTTKAGICLAYIPWKKGELV